MKVFIKKTTKCKLNLWTTPKGISFEEFVEDSKTIDAVVRNFEIIGEAANRLPEEFKDSHPHIDWFRLRGFRNKIVHDYLGIDYSIVWQVKETHLPALIKILEKSIF